MVCEDKDRRRWPSGAVSLVAAAMPQCCSGWNIICLPLAARSHYERQVRHPLISSRGLTVPGPREKSKLECVRPSRALYTGSPSAMHRRSTHSTDVAVIMKVTPRPMPCCHAQLSHRLVVPSKPRCQPTLNVRVPSATPRFRYQCLIWRRRSSAAHVQRPSRLQIAR